MRNLAKILALSGSLFLSSSAFAAAGNPDLFVPDKMHVKLVKDAKDYYALISFFHDGELVTVKDHIDPLWHGLFGYNGKFDFTKESMEDPDFFIPDEMNVSLVGGGKDYHAKISFDYNKRKVTVDYLVEVQWQFLYEGEFKFTRDQ